MSLWYNQLLCYHKGTYFVRYDKINKVRILKCAYCGKEKVYA